MHEIWGATSLFDGGVLYSRVLSQWVYVHFVAHPVLTGVVHLWAGSRRWRRKRRKIENCLSPGGAILEKLGFSMNELQRRTFT